MTRRKAARPTRDRGAIDELPSGALRVRVYAGVDPLTGKRHDLLETVQPGPNAWREAEAARARLVADVAERRNPRTNATIDQLLTRYLEQFPGAPSTRGLYETHIRNHISPCLGHLRVGQLDAETLDSFYAELRRCRTRCAGKGRRRTDHHTEGRHSCDARCGPHQCSPLAASTIRQIHFILSAAYRKAVRWRWVGTSPTVQAEAPRMPAHNPQPPTPKEAAVIVNASWRDPDWGAFIWTLMTTGMRRGELCAVRVSAVDLEPGRETIWLKQAIRREPDGSWTEAGLKTHQQRRIALDVETAAVLGEHLDRCRARTEALGFELPDDAFLFSLDPDGSTPLTPGSVTSRYYRMVQRLGIKTTLHKLRHYSATELITNGVDARTVAGRLGHGGGGAMTLKAYSAWVSEADQRAAKGLGAGMPQRPTDVDRAELIRQDPRHPYEVVAAGISHEIKEGTLAPGGGIPSVADLAATYGVSVATAKRGLALAQEWGLLAELDRDRLEAMSRPTAVRPAESPPVPTRAESSAGVVLLDLVLLRLGVPVTRFTSAADPRSVEDLQRLLVDAVRRRGGDLEALAEYELEVRTAGDAELIMTFVALRADV